MRNAVYVTGHKGMLGSALLTELQFRNHIVSGVDLCSSVKPSVDFAAMDIRSLTLSGHMATIKPDIVIHCAAMLGVQNTDTRPEICKDININGTKNVMDAAARNKIKLFVFLSSSEVYGDIGYCKEYGDISPKSVYAYTKLQSERDLQQFAADTGINVLVCRMFNCYGPGQVAKFVVPRFLRSLHEKGSVDIFGDPRNRRSYLYSHDAAIHLVNLIEHFYENRTEGTYEIVNVAGYDVSTLATVAQTIKDALVAADKYPYGFMHLNLLSDNYTDRIKARDVPNRLADTKRLQALSLHVPRTLYSGIRAVVKNMDTLKDNWVF
jgi:nucleoside-diphosphate-sugar epimerase